MSVFTQFKFYFKALCAEIIQSCRDLIQINQLYREAVHQGRVRNFDVNCFFK